MHFADGVEKSTTIIYDRGTVVRQHNEWIPPEAI